VSAAATTAAGARTPSTSASGSVRDSATGARTARSVRTVGADTVVVRPAPGPEESGAVTPYDAATSSAMKSSTAARPRITEAPWTIERRLTITLRNGIVTNPSLKGAYPVAQMRSRSIRFRLVFVVAAFALLFGAVEAHGSSGTASPVVENDRHGAEVGATNHHETAGVANASRLRRFTPFDAVLGTLFVIALWLSWPCATRTRRIRSTVSRFSIRRRGPPSLLAAG
jgi:hypothetical protein